VFGSIFCNSYKPIIILPIYMISPCSSADSGSSWISQMLRMSCEFFPAECCRHLKLLISVVLSRHLIPLLFQCVSLTQVLCIAILLLRFISFTKLYRVGHTRSYWRYLAILDHTWPFFPMFGHIGPHRAVMCYTGSYLVILVHIGLYLAIACHTWRY